MGTAAFQRNALVRIDGRVYRLLRKVTDELWQLEDERTKRISEHSDDALRTMYVSRRLIFETRPLDRRRPQMGDIDIGRPYRDLKPHELEEAKIRRAYAIEAMKVPATRSALEPVAREVWAKLRQPERIPHWTSVYRWRKRMVDANRNIFSVVSRTPCKGNRTSRYPTEVIRIVEENIDSIYLTKEKLTQQDVLDKSILDVKRENKLRPQSVHLPEPTRRLVGSMIHELPAYDVCLAREGRDVAMARFRAVLGQHVTKAPLERAEIDHTKMDLLVIDDESGLPLGRPSLTICLDGHSRAVLGSNIGFQPANYLSVARCLKAAFLPKVGLNLQYPDIVNTWLSHGVMRELVMDNGPEFHSESLELACHSLGIEIHYAPRKKAWFKGKVERFLGTLNRGVAHKAPGTTFSNILEREDYDPAKHAVVRLSVLKHIVNKWIVDVYHQRPHRTLKMPPAVMWKNSVRPEDIFLPANPEDLDAILGRRKECALRAHGIDFEGLRYNSPELTELRKILGSDLTVEISVDDGDIGKIVVFSPDKKRMFTVPALSQEYARDMTAWQHKICKRYAARAAKSYDPTGWLEAKQEIAELIRNELGLKTSRNRRRTRAHVARYLENGNAQIATQQVVESPATTVKGADVNPAAPCAEGPAHETGSKIPPMTALEQIEVPPIPRFRAVLRNRSATTSDS